MPLEERLELDIDEALRGIDQIEEALGGSATSFKVALADALDLLSAVAVGDVDATSVTTGIDQAVDAANLEPAIEADASGVTSSIDAAVDAADTDPTINADASGVTAALDAAIAGADDEVVIQAITDQVIADIEAAVQAADTTVDIDADTSGAQEALQDTAGAAGQASESLDETSDAMGALQGTSQLAAGDIAGVGATLGAITPRGSAAAAAALAVSTAIGATTRSALESVTAQRRYNEVLGEFADEVDGINIPGFADDFESLATATGNSDEALKLSSARIFEMGRSAGVAGPQVAETTKQIDLLAIRASVVNPTLGDAGAAADRLTGALARGGKTLNDFGLSITAAEIEARALADTGKRSADELSQYERAAAGAAIATERLGDRLATDITRGADQPVIALRRLREEFGNTLEEIGQPLLDPLISNIEAGQPILADLAETFGQLAEVALPVLVQALDAMAPAIGSTTDLLQLLFRLLGPLIGVIELIPDPILQVVAAAVLFNRILPVVGDGITTLVTRLATGGGLAGAFTGVLNPMTAVAVGLGVLVAGITAHNAAEAEHRRRIQESTDALLEEGKAVSETIAAIAENRIPSNQIDDLKRLGLTFGEVGDLAAGGEEGFRRFIDTMEATGEIAPSVADALRDQNVSVSQLRAGNQLLGVSAQDAADSNFGLVETFRNLAEEEQKAARAALDTLVARDLLTTSAERAAEANHTAADGTIDYVGALEDVRGTSPEAAAAADTFTEAVEDQAAATTKAEEALQELLDATLGFIDSQIGADNASRAFADALVDVKEKQDAHTAAIREHGRSSVEASAAQRDLEDAIRGARDQAIDAAKAQVQLAVDQAAAAGGTIEASEKMAIYRQALVEAAAQASGPTRDAILGVIATLDATPVSHDIDITANTAQARAQIAELNRELERLGIGASLNIALARAGGLMAGGSMQEGWTWVGEAGPELAHKRGSQVEVFSAGRSRDMGSGPAGPSIGEINVYEAVSAEATAEAIAARWELEAVP